MDPRVNLWPDLLGWILPVTGGTGAARCARWLLENIWGQCFILVTGLK